MCFWIIKLKNIKGNSTWTIPRRQNLGWHHTFLNHSILNRCLWMATYWSNTTTSHSITWYRVSNIWIFQIQYSFYILDVWSLPIFSMPFSLTFSPEDSIFSSPLCHTLSISFMNALKLLIISENLRMPMVRIYRDIGLKSPWKFFLFLICSCINERSSENLPNTNNCFGVRRSKCCSAFSCNVLHVSKTNQPGRWRGSSRK